MELQGTYTFKAAPVAVWDLLMDTGALAGCIPGCDGLEPAGHNQYRARLTVSMAAVSGSFEGTVALTDLAPPSSYKLVIDGKGRTGFVSGTSAITLEEHGGDTLVHVRADMQVGGPVARVGQRLIGSVAKMMMDRFFACLQSRL